MSQNLLAGNLALKARKHSHAVYFYDNDSCLMSELTRFVGSAAAAGDSAIIIATKPHREELEKRLKTLGFDTDNPKFRRRYLVFDAAETLSKFMVEGSPDPASFSQIMINTLVRARIASENPQPRVVAFGEMVALLWARGETRAAIQLERLWNELAHANTFSLLCAYPISHFSGIDDSKLMSDVCAEHSDIVPSSNFTRSELQ